MNIFHFLNPETILNSVGLIGLFIIIFAESGLLIGFFLPGDSLLFVAGFLAPSLHIHIFVLAGGVALMAILGDSVGYWIGKKIGPAIFKREESLFFSKKHVERAHIFFAKHGPSSIILARFIPIVRTFVPMVAGVGAMTYRTFLTYNIIGGILWGAGITLLGSYFGSIIPDIDQYLLPIIIVIVILSLLPVMFEIIKISKKN